MNAAMRLPAGVAGPVAAAACSPDPEVVPKKAKRRRFTAKYKLGVLEKADACTKAGEIGALLRREGLWSSHLTAWRKQREAGVLSGLTPKKRGRRARERNPLEKQVQELARDKARLERELEKSRIIIEYQKKASEILGMPLKVLEIDHSET